jgi:hypothetical protein
MAFSMRSAAAARPLVNRRVRHRDKGAIGAARG